MTGTTTNYGYYQNSTDTSTLPNGALADLSLTTPVPGTDDNATLTNDHYVYDGAGRIHSITVGDETFTYAYYPNTNLVNTVTSSSGVTTGYTYYADTNQLHTITVTDGSATLYSSVLGYNTSYQLQDADTSFTNSSQASLTQDWTYGYDSTDQLASGTGVGTAMPNGSDLTLSYSFNAAGNASWGNANLLNQYTTGPTGQPITYNARGDQTDDSTQATGWDAADRLASVTPDDPLTGKPQVMMGYDSSNRLIWSSAYSWNTATNSWSILHNQIRLQRLAAHRHLQPGPRHRPSRRNLPIRSIWQHLVCRWPRRGRLPHRLRRRHQWPRWVS